MDSPIKSGNDIAGDDRHFMIRALALAEGGLGRVAPNPSVGCLIVKDGQVIGEGRTQDGGRPHAEKIALDMAGDKAKGATAYVTLEPCYHDDRSSCSSYLIEAGIAKVVVGCRDQNPAIWGRGISALKQSGINVVEGVMEKECAAINRGFFFTKTIHRPLITLKMAVSADNKITGPQRWITGEAARADVHLLRARHDAILTGVGTIISDDPQLTTRVAGITHVSKKVILDTTFRINEEAKVLAGSDGGEVIVFTTREQDGKTLKGARIISVATGLDGRVSISAVLERLAAEGVTRVMVEAGQGVFSAFLSAGLWDELYLYRAGAISGEAYLPAVTDPDLMPTSGMVRREQLGDDILEIYKRLPPVF